MEETQEPTKDLRFQLAKIGNALASGEYSANPSADTSSSADAAGSDEASASDVAGIRPKIFKDLVGAGHMEFASSRQQDAAEYLFYLFTKIERADRQVPGPKPTEAFQFKVEERYQHVEGAK
eukprot:SAG31_NODE_31583_length_366_cov_0.962547_1_plen_121_part_11